uniref:G-protein coupled receptors family 1 profile domain-containing protein n=1 Tax=Alexandrium monilatum TaxID=311494 RepID=A0A7S4Q6E4_9DINO
MAPIRECDAQRMERYTSYDLAILTPILFPLTAALVVQLLSWVFLWRERRQTNLSATILCGGELLVETFFGIFCLGSCVANFAERDYVGGTSACAFQAWYAGWYTFSQLPMLAALSAAVGYRESWGAGSLPSPSACAGVVFGCLAVGALVAALPFMGVSHFVFPKDYCMYDLQDTPFAMIFLLWFFVAAACVTLGPLRLAILRCVQGSGPEDTNVQILCIMAVVLFLWGWVVSAAIAVRGLAKGSVCSDDFATSSTVYGFSAVFLHVQQLANPVLYAVFWRRALSAPFVPWLGTSTTKVVEVSVQAQDASAGG